MNKMMPALLMAAVLHSASSHGDDLPLYEIGVGAGWLNAPHYLGSDQSFDVVAPLPYIVYRGERVQAGRAGVRTILFDNDRLDFSISLNAGLPVDSDDNDARMGMPDLHFLGEIGPALRYVVHQGENGEVLRLDLPLRAAFTINDFSSQHRGWTGAPALVFLDTYRDWRWSTSLTALFGNRRYQSYFYGVDPGYATPQRPAYEAGSGYTGTQLSLSATRRFGNWYVGGFARFYTLAGSANEDSPLFVEDQNYSAGLMLSWVFHQSAQRVKWDTEDSW